MKHHRSTNRFRSLCLLAPLLFLSEKSLAQTTPVTGDLTVSGSVKTGTSNSAGGTEFRQDGLIIAKGTYGGDFVPGTLTADDQYSGTRMLWYPGKAAFRAGRVSGSMWNDTSIGVYSTAFGLCSVANGWASVAMGSHTTAGMYGVAMGFFTTADFSSAAFGDHSAAVGGGSMAAGSLTTAYGSCSTAMGLLTIATGGRSTALGEATSANALCSTAVGRTNIGGGSPNTWIPTDPLFEIGNGTPLVDIEGAPYVPAAPSNALTVYKNGNMDVQGVVTCAPGGDIPMFTGN